jgi:hypothetical protein
MSYLGMKERNKALEELNIALSKPIDDDLAVKIKAGLKEITTQ